MGKKEEPIVIIEEKEEEELEKEEIKDCDMRWGNGKARIKKICTYDVTGENRKNFRTGETMVLKMEYEVKEAIKNATFGIGVFRGDGLSCYGVNTYLDKLEKFDLNKDGVLIVTLKNVNLLPAEYWIDVAIQADISEAIDYYRDACRFQMYSYKEDIGICRLNHSWEIEGRMWEEKE